MTDQPEPMTLKDKLLLLVFKNAVVDAMVKEVNGTKESAKAPARPGDRQRLLPDLVSAYHELSSKSFQVKLPGGKAIATVTLKETAEQVKLTDQEALIEFLKEAHPDLVETYRHPGSPAWTETVQHDAVDPWEEDTLRRGAVDDLLKKVKPVDGVFITEAGEPVPGLEHIPAGEPESFSIIYKGGDDGRAAVIQAWRDGELADLDFNSTIPRIEGYK